MWQTLQNTTYNITEIIVRIVILSFVCILHANVDPHQRHIDENDLLTIYNLPRMESITPVWVMVMLVVFVPPLVLVAHSYLTNNYNDLTQSLLAWTLGLSLNAFVTVTGKLIVGRPRPDFFYRCFPDGEMTPDLQCTGSIKDEMEGRKSFPSGHSSFSFCSLGFVSIWLFGVLGVFSRNRGQSLRVITCLFPLIVAQIISMSRYCDNHHHWEDIVIGSGIGLAAAYFCYLQYYYPLSSDMSGQPYHPIPFEIYLGDDSEEESCTSRIRNSSNGRAIGLRNKK